MIYYRCDCFTVEPFITRSGPNQPCFSVLIFDTVVELRKSLHGTAQWYIHGAWYTDVPFKVRAA